MSLFARTVPRLFRGRMNKMIKCNSKNKCNIYGICVIDMDAQQSAGGVIMCSKAEDCDYNHDEILKECKCAELKGVE